MTQGKKLLSHKVSSWLTSSALLNHKKGDVQGRGKKWAARSALFPILAGILCASVVDSVAVGGQGRAALAEIVKDPTAVLDGRSPGERAAGAKFNTKHKAVASPMQRHASAIPPVKDVGLPVIEEAADPAMGTALFAQPEAPPAETALPLTGEPPVGVGGPPSFAPPVLIPPTGVAPNPDPGPGPGPGPGPDPVDPLPAIPEPATWLTLILGMFAAGAALRLRRAGAPKVRIVEAG